jgi:hypothetical protein
MNINGLSDHIKYEHEFVKFLCVNNIVIEVDKNDIHAIKISFLSIIKSEQEYYVHTCLISSKELVKIFLNKYKSLLKKLNIDITDKYTLESVNEVSINSYWFKKTLFEKFNLNIYNAEYIHSWEWELKIYLNNTDFLNYSLKSIRNEIDKTFKGYIFAGN